VVLGASIPLSGPLAGFGICQQWGYETAVKDLNQAGGITIDRTPRRIRPLIRDDKTDPALTADNTERLIADDGAVALLGSCTPPLVHAGAAVAERSKIPLVTGCTPLGAFRAARQWACAWNLFFDEHDLASVPFRMMADMGLATNKKVAILTDDGPHESKLAGQLWPAQAARAGCIVVLARESDAAPQDARIARH
jgi:branched-chain amino acid transport system substrate-binding protein